MKYLLLFLSFSLFAGIDQAPKSFSYKNSKAVFSDFITANYEIVYDYKNRKAYSIAKIRFNTLEEGYPIFDSLNKPTKTLIDGIKVNTQEISDPDKVTKFLVPSKVIKAGLHTYEIHTPITNGVTFSNRGVSSAFFIKDLTDRNFLEKYIPTNYEFDQYEMKFKIKVLGSKKKYRIYSNGVTTQTGKNTFEVAFPSFFTSSSLYFHMTPKGKFHTLHFKYRSINKKLIPVTIYSHKHKRNKRFAKRTIKILKELEKDYGPWPHPNLLIYAAKMKGGMEYVGATMTSFKSLGHELQHSYFAKGILPANGNSGWMDEAIASWRDRGHKTSNSVDYYSFNLGNHSPYIRKTDRYSYKKGRSFMAYLDYQLKVLGSKGLKDFLKKYFNKRKYTTVTTYDFINDLKEYTDHDFQKDFDRYIFGKLESKNNRSPAILPENPHHGHITNEQFKTLL